MNMFVPENIKLFSKSINLKLSYSTLQTLTVIQLFYIIILFHHLKQNGGSYLLFLKKNYQANVFSKQFLKIRNTILLGTTKSIMINDVKDLNCPNEFYQKRMRS